MKRIFYFLMIGTHIFAGELSQSTDMLIENMSKNIFNKTAIFFAALEGMPAQIKTVVGALTSAQESIEKEYTSFCQSGDISQKIDSLSIIVGQLAIAAEVFVGSAIPQGNTVDFGNHQYQGILVEISKVLTLFDDETSAKLNNFIIIIKEKAALLDVVAQALHQVASDLSPNGINTRTNIFIQAQAIMTALDTFPAKISEAKTVLIGAIEVLKNSYNQLQGEDTLANKVTLMADIIVQLAVVAEVIVGSQIKPGSAFDIGGHAFQGILNDINAVLSVVDEESSIVFGPLSSIIKDNVAYLDIIVHSLRSVVIQLEKYAQAHTA
jgi:hypothetical protein